MVATPKVKAANAASPVQGTNIPNILPPSSKLLDNTLEDMFFLLYNGKKASPGMRIDKY